MQRQKEEEETERERVRDMQKEKEVEREESIKEKEERERVREMQRQKEKETEKKEEEETKKLEEEERERMREMQIQKEEEMKEKERMKEIQLQKAENEREIIQKQKEEEERVRMRDIQRQREEERESQKQKDKEEEERERMRDIQRQRDEEENEREKLREVQREKEGKREEEVTRKLEEEEMEKIREIRRQREEEEEERVKVREMQRKKEEAEEMKKKKEEEEKIKEIQRQKKEEEYKRQILRGMQKQIEDEENEREKMRGIQRTKEEERAKTIKQKIIEDKRLEEIRKQKEIEKEKQRIKEEKERKIEIMNRKTQEKEQRNKLFLNKLAQDTKTSLMKINTKHITWSIMQEIIKTFNERFPPDSEDPKINFVLHYRQKCLEEKINLEKIKNIAEKIFNASNKNSPAYLKIIFRFPKLRKTFLAKYRNYEQIKKIQLSKVINQYLNAIKKELNNPNEEELGKYMALIGLENWNQNKSPEFPETIQKIFKELKVKIFNVLKDMIDSKVCSDGKHVKMNFQVKVRFTKLMEKVFLGLKNLKNLSQEDDPLKKIIEFVMEKSISNSDTIPEIMGDFANEFLKADEKCDPDKVEEYYNLGFYNMMEIKHLNYLEQGISALEKVEADLKQVLLYLSKG